MKQSDAEVLLEALNTIIRQPEYIRAETKEEQDAIEALTTLLETEEFHVYYDGVHTGKFLFVER